jgi:hypothetical protein
MTATTIPAASAGATSPTQSQGKSKARARTTSVARTHFTASRRAMFANAVLVLLIIAAGFGAWRTFDEFGTDDPPPANLGAVIGTPASEVTAQSTASIATPEHAANCDFSQDIPIFPGLDESPLDQTSLVITPEGDLVLTCATQERQTLASDVDLASPLGWPGIVWLRTVDPASPDGGLTRILNIFTQQLVNAGPHEGNHLEGDQESPWYVTPSDNTSSDWIIIDLRTMESRLLSIYTGGSLPFELALSTVVNGSEGSLVIALHYRGDYNRTIIPNDDDLPGSILVHDGSIDESQWLDVPEFLVEVTEPQLSPDGQFLALKGGDGTSDPEEAYVTHSVIRVSDGVEVGTSGIVEDSISGAIWSTDSSQLLYTDQDRLMSIPVEGSAEPVTIYEDETQRHLANPRLTVDPATVVIYETETDASSTLVDEDATQSAILLVNLGTGETVRLEGRVAFPLPIYPAGRYVVMYDPIMPLPATISYRVVDVLTGEIVGNLTDVPVVGETDGAPDANTLAITSDSEAAIIGFSSTYFFLIRSLDGRTEIEPVPLPEGVQGGYEQVVAMWLSPDGRFLTLNGDSLDPGTNWYLPLDDVAHPIDQDDWIGLTIEPNVNLSEGSYPTIEFVRGQNRQQARLVQKTGPNSNS